MISLSAADSEMVDFLKNVIKVFFGGGTPYLVSMIMVVEIELV